MTCKFWLCGFFKEELHCGYNTRILFEELDNIDRKKYIKETKQKNSHIDNKNNDIKKYNNSIDKIIEEINKLNDWNNFIEFDGKKYGYPQKVKNSVHIENNCNGNMIFLREETEYRINDRPFCNYSDGETTYCHFECNRCKYTHKTVKEHIPKGRYVSKCGFWWK